MKLIITRRDKELLEGLTEYFQLTTKQIRRLYFNNIKTETVLRRLRKLKDKGYLRRFIGGDIGDRIWTLGKKAERVMAQEIKLKAINRNSLGHDLMANELRIHLESEKIGKNYVSGFTLRHKASVEKNPYDRTKDTIPDWIFSIKTKQGVTVIALECEINYKGKHRMVNIFDKYFAKERIHYLWYVVPNEPFKKRILKCFEDVYHRKGKYYLWVSTFDEFFIGKNEISFCTIEGTHKLRNILFKDAHSHAHEVSNV